MPVSSFGPPTSGSASSSVPTQVSLNSGGTNSSLIVPAGALPAGTTLSVYPVTSTATLVSEVPAGNSYVVSWGVSWQSPDGTSPTSAIPITLVITDPKIKVGDTINEVTASGLIAVSMATVNGSAVITFHDDPIFVITGTALVAQSPLIITSQSGTFGTALTLTTSGGSGTGATTFTATDGTAHGCALSGMLLTATSAGTCIVTAVKAADSTYRATSSALTVVTFVSTLRPRPSPVILTFAFNRSAPSAASVHVLAILARKLQPGASVTLIGYAFHNGPLARSRSIIVKRFLSGRVRRLHVRMIVKINFRVQRVTVITTAQ
jgi:hypothetical protein